MQVIRFRYFTDENGNQILSYIQSLAHQVQPRGYITLHLHFLIHPKLPVKTSAYSFKPSLTILNNCIMSVDNNN